MLNLTMFLSHKLAWQLYWSSYLWVMLWWCRCGGDNTAVCSCQSCGWTHVLQVSFNIHPTYKGREREGDVFYAQLPHTAILVQVSWGLRVKHWNLGHVYRCCLSLCVCAGKWTGSPASRSGVNCTTSMTANPQCDTTGTSTVTGYVTVHVCTAHSRLLKA